MLYTLLHKKSPEYSAAMAIKFALWQCNKEVLAKCRNIVFLCGNKGVNAMQILAKFLYYIDWTLGPLIY